MPKEKLTGRVSYRLEGEELKQVRRLAAGKNLSPNDWCREIVREKLAAIRAQASQGLASSTRQMVAHADRVVAQTQARPAETAAPSQPPGQVLTRGERILFEELVRLRWMVETGMQMHLRGGGVGIDKWNYLVDQVNKIGAGKAKEMVDEWLVKYGVKPRT
jgi:hypothetical protein